MIENRDSGRVGVLFVCLGNNCYYLIYMGKNTRLVQLWSTVCTKKRYKNVPIFVQVKGTPRWALKTSQKQGPALG